MQIRKKISKRDYIISGIIGFILLFVIWSLLTYTGVVKPFFLPSPTDTANSILNLFNEFNLFSDILASLNRILVGFILAVVIAVPLGIVIGTIKPIEAFFEPIVSFIRYIPPSAFVPLAILWFGVGDIEKFFIIFIGTAPYLLILVADIVSHVKNEFIDVALTLGANTKELYTKVIIPSSLPAIWDSMRFMFGISWTLIIIAEIVASNSGLGHVIIQSQRFLQTSNVIGVIILIGLFGLFTDYLFRLSYNKIFPWSEKER